MGAFDWLSPQNPHAGQLSDEAWQYYRRQQMGQTLRTLGAGLSTISRGGVPTAPAGRGGAGGGGGAMSRAMKMDRAIEARQDRDAARDEKKRAREHAIRVSEALSANTQGATTNRPGTPGIYGKASVNQQNLMPQAQANRARLLGLLARGDPKAALTEALKRPKGPQYGKPTRVNKAGKDLLVRFSKSGQHPPREVAGYGPSTKPDRPTALQTNVADTMRVFNMSEKDARQMHMWSKQKSPAAFHRQIFSKAVGRYSGDEEEAKEIADAALKMFYPDSPEAQAIPLPAPPPPPKRGMVSQGIKDVTDYFTGTATAAPGGDYSEGQTVQIGGKSYEVQGRNPDGTWSLMDLETGELRKARNR